MTAIKTKKEWEKYKKFYSDKNPMFESKHIPAAPESLPCIVSSYISSNYDIKHSFLYYDDLKKIMKKFSS